MSPRFFGKNIDLGIRETEIVLTEAEKKLARRLVELARHKKMTSYSTQAALMDRPMLARHPVYCKMLDRINRYTYFKYGLFLAAIVKHQSSDTVGMGFFVAVCDCVNLKHPKDKMDLKQNWAYYNKFWKDEIAKLFARVDDIVIE